MVADAGQVVEYEAFQFFQLCAHAGLVNPFQIWIIVGVTCEPLRSSSQFGPVLISIGLPVIFEMGMAVGWSVAGGSIKQIPVAEGEGLVVIFQGG